MAEVTETKTYPVAFLFTGQGSQYNKMGAELYAKEPVFKQNFDLCATWLEAQPKYLPCPLAELMFSEDQPIINETRYSQVCLFVLEYCLAQLLKSRGIVPDILLGHSAGEYVAVTVGGALTLEEGLELIMERARVMQVCPQQDGSMWAMRVTEKDVRSQMLFRRSRLALAAVNGPKSVVLSGPRSEAKKLIDKLKASAKELEVSHAFHSPLMSFAADRLKTLCGKFNFQHLQIPVVSNIDATVLTPETLNNTQHWADHLLGCVRFADGMKALESMGTTVFVEVGPQSTLVKMGKACVEGGDKYKWLCTMEKGKDQVEQFNSVVAAVKEGAVAESN